jgi:hypothetical protein
MDYSEDLVTDDYSVRTHSGLGIVSFVIAIAVGLFEFILFAIAGVLETTTPGGIDENSPATILLGLALVGGLLVNVLGIGLGIGGLCQRYRRKLFAVLGVVLGSVALLGVLLLMIIGLILE